MALLKRISPVFSDTTDQETICRAQAALQYLINIGMINIADPTLLVDFSMERSNMEYGSATIRILQRFQQQQSPNQTGVFDNETARQINDILEIQGMLAVAPTQVETNQVFGVVRNSLGMPVIGVRVVVFDRDLRRDEPLGSQITDASGGYKINYAPDKVASGEAGTADIVVKVLNYASSQLQFDQWSINKQPLVLFSNVEDDQAYLFVSEVRYNAPAELEWNITLDSNIGLQRSEFSSILETVLPLLPGQGVQIADLKETEEHRDLSFLHQETGIDVRLLALFILAHRYSNQLKEGYSNQPIPPAIFYAWMRTGLPQDFDNLIPIGKAQKRAALTLAIQENIVEAWYDREGLDGDVEYIARNYAPAERFSDGVLMSTLFGDNDDLQQKVQEILDDPSQEVASLSQLLDQAGAGEIPRQRVLLNNELLNFTFNHADLARTLSNNIGAGATRFTDLLRQPGQKLYNSSAWRIHLENLDENKFPAFIAGADASEKVSNYASLLAASVNFQFPTESLAERVIRDEMPLVRQELKQSVGQFLHRAAANKGFHIGTTDLVGFFSRPDAFEGFVGDREALKSEIGRLRQVYQLTPDDRKAAVLLTHGFDSAAKIARMPLSTFIDRVATDLKGAEWAEAIHRKAIGIQATEMYWQLALKAFQLTPPMHALASAPSPAERSVPAAYGPVEISHIQSALGSFDYSDCADCESITSPGAYLTDLFQYLPEAVRTALFARRPDLKYLPLTCDSTQTLVPYIDLVNEILEYYIVHQKLDENTPVANRPGRTQEDILSQPQRVEQVAYALLRQQKYPLALPFDRDLELLRAFAETTNTNLQSLLDAARDDEAQSEAGLLALLGISVWERENIYDRIADPLVLSELYGITTDGAGQPLTAANALNAMNTRLSKAKELLARTGFSFEELVELLRKLIEQKYGSAYVGLSFEELGELLQQGSGSLLFNPIILKMGQNSDANQIESFTIQHADGTALSVEEWGYMYAVARLKHRLQWPLQEVMAALQLKLHHESYGAFLVKLAPYVLAAKGLGLPGTVDLINTVRKGSIPALLTNRLRLSDAALQRIQSFADATYPYQHRPEPLRLYHTLQVAKEIEAEKIPLAKLEYLLLNEGPESRIGQEKQASVDAFVLELHRQMTEVNQLFALPSTPTVQQVRERLLSVYNEADVELILSFFTGNFTVPIDLSEDELTDQGRVQVLDVAQQLGNQARINWDERKVLVSGFLDETRKNALNFLFQGNQYQQFIDERRNRIMELLQGFPGAELLSLEFGFNVGESHHLNMLMQLVTPYLVKSAKKERVFKLLTERLNLSSAQLGALISEESGALPSAYLPDNRAIKDFMFSVPGPGESAQASDWSGEIDPESFYAVVPTDGKYQILSRAAHADTGVVIKIGADFFMYSANTQLQPVPNSLIYDWKAGQLVAFKIPKGSDGPVVQLYGQASPLPPRLIDEAQGLPTYQVNSIVNQLYRLERAAFFIKHYQLLPEDIDAISRMNNFWRFLPGRDHDNTNAVGLPFYKSWRDLSGYVRLRNDWTEGKESLAGVLNDPSADSVSATLQAWSGLSEEEWTGLVEQFDLGQPNKRLAVMRRIRRCINVGRQSGMLPVEIAALSFGNDLNMESVVSNALVRLFTSNGRHEKTKALFDVLRERQRDALIAYLLNTNTNTNWKSAADLYEHFLIDVEMGACMQTSRLRLALSSVQLFIQRWLLNLESQLELFPADHLAAQWPWRKNYRVWEANRKVLLYPENWLDPEFRTEKSELFEQLESELLQGDIGDEVVEKALTNYLDGLNEIAKLEICGLHIENKDQINETTLHVIGRTESDPRTHYYRKQHKGNWTFWEKIECNIDGKHVMPVMWGGSLFVFWLTFMEKSGTETEGQTLAEMGNQTISRIAEVQLAWTEYRYGKWQPRRVGQLEMPITLEIPNESTSYRSRIRSIVELHNSEDSQYVLIHVYYDTRRGKTRQELIKGEGKVNRIDYDSQFEYESSYKLTSRLGLPTIENLQKTSVDLSSFKGAKSDNNIIKIDHTRLEGTTSDNILLPSVSNARICLDSSLLCPQPGKNLFFFQDDERCLLIETETTEADNSVIQAGPQLRTWLNQERSILIYNPAGTRVLETKVKLVQFGGLVLNGPKLSLSNMTQQINLSNRTY